jgi:hypothetical protein
MSTIISNKSATFKILDKMKPGDQFSGKSLQLSVSRESGKDPFVATVLRYVRIWRNTHLQIICINKAKSFYEVRKK